MKTTELKPGDIVAYNDNVDTIRATVISIDNNELTIKSKHCTVQITYVSEDQELEELGMVLVKEGE